MMDELEQEYNDLTSIDQVELEQAIVNGFLSKACGHLLPDGYAILVDIEGIQVVISPQYDDGYRTLGMRMAMGKELDMEDGTQFRINMAEEQLLYDVEE